jgi:hypothetical protein
MKNLVLVVFLFFGGYPLCAQTVEIKKSYRLDMGETKGFHPVFNTAGNLLAFTSENSDGLKVYDFARPSVTAVSREPGAGFLPVFTEENQLVYKHTAYRSKRKYEGLKTYDLQQGAEKTLVEPQRDLKPAQKSGRGAMALQNQTLLKTPAAQSEKTTPPYVWSDGRCVNVYREGRTVRLNPIGQASGYVWASLSPDGTMILFTAVAVGTFVTDLEGRPVAALGYLNAPVWYDNRCVVGMQDKDDGQRVTESIVVLKTIDGRVSKALSAPGQVALYPTAAAAARKVAYNTAEGDIYVVEIEINQ